jgi:hypothetical protein
VGKFILAKDEEYEQMDGNDEVHGNISLMVEPLIRIIFGMK